MKNEIQGSKRKPTQTKPFDFCIFCLEIPEKQRKRSHHLLSENLSLPKNPLRKTTIQRIRFNPFMKRTPDECRARIERNPSDASHSSNVSSLGPSNRVTSLKLERVNEKRIFGVKSVIWGRRRDR